MANCDLFVQSSAWEGFGNALVEAAALGIPVVSTDCDYGPRDILQNGRYGPLVPVGDSDALAEAITATLKNPLKAHVLQSAVQAYTAEACADGYLRALGF
jgi:glycosyltransferase involved in cell wall biosynthesis